MTRKDHILALQSVLARRREALRSALAGDWSLLQELRTQSKGDVVDFAVDAVQDEIGSQLAEVENRELAQIEIALERMATGGYGICEHCHEAIPLARLQALAYATLCIRCQRAAEKSSGAHGTADRGRLADMEPVHHGVDLSDVGLDATYRDAGRHVVAE